MSKFIRICAICGIIACVLEFIVEFCAASKYPEYSSISQSISYLGNPESPTYHLIQIWSIFFSGLFISFAFGFYHAFKDTFSRVKIVSILIILYALGEGVGAGMFPMDNQNSWTNVVHNIFSSIGDIALVLVPFMMLSCFKKAEWIFSLLISLMGIIFGLLFVVAKLEFNSQAIPYIGLWQRIFEGVYYLYFIFIAYQMYLKSEHLNHY